MKKIFSLLAAVLFAGSMMAETATMKYAGSTTTNMDATGANNAATLGLDANLFTVLAEKGGNQNAPGLNKAGDIRLYADQSTGNGNSIIVSIANGGTIDSIALDIKQTATYVVKAGETAVTGVANVFAINATSFSIQNTTTGATTQLQLNKITIYYTAGEAPAVATPVISGEAEFTDSVIVTITCSTPETDIYYTTDGTTDPKCDCAAAPEYTHEIVLKETTTIMAAAYTGNDWSAVASKTFTKTPSFDSFEALVAAKLADKTLVSVNFADVLIDSIYTSSKGVRQGIYINVMDSTGKKPVEIYYNKDSVPAEWAAGDTLSGTIRGNWTVFNGQWEIVPTTANWTWAELTRKAAAEEEEPEVEYDYVYDWADTLGTTVLGSGVEASTVKIHNNTDQYAALKFTVSYVYADSKYAVIKPAKGKFLAGDSIYFAAVISNDATDGSKYAMVDFYAADGSTRLFRGDTVVNGKKSADEPKLEGFVLEADQDSLLFGRYGNTSLFVLNVAVLREKGEEPALPDPTNCAEAREAALSVSANNELYNGGKEYTIEGYVTAIQTAYSEANKNITFWMADSVDGGNVLEAYRAVCDSAAAAPGIGDKVAVTGKLTKYNTTPEFAQGCTFVITEKSAPAVNLGEKTIAEFLALKNYKDTCILTGVVDSIVNDTYGNLYLSDTTATLYIYGVLNAAGESKKFKDLGVAVGDTLTVKATYNEYNGAPQATNAIFVEVKKAPASVEVVEITITEGLEWQDAVAVGGWWQIMGENEQYFITLSNISTTQVAGIYTVDNLDPDYSYVREVNGTEKITFTDGAVTVAVAETGIVTVAGELLGKDGKLYKIALTCDPSIVNPYKYDEDEADFDYNFDLYQSQISQGVAIVQAQANDAMIVLAIIPQEGQTALTAGEYVVTDTPAYGTVFAGSYENDSFSPSFAATLIELYYSEIWYLVSGKVTVAENLDITVDALNSNGKAIKATLKAPTEAIDAVDAAKKAIKSIKNGQLIIEKNGVEYNVLGTRL